MGKVQKKKDQVTVKNIRANNKLNIIKQLVKGKDLTRNILAKENKISLMTVKHIVDSLVQQGIVEEHASASAVGRKPMALNIAEKYGNVVCINLTSTQSVSYIIYDIRRQMLAENTLEIPEQDETYEETLMRLIREIKDRLQKISTVTVGVGISVPSAYYETEDLVNYDLIPEFKDFHIRSFFQKQFEMENVMVLHDVFLAAKSEYEAKSVRDDSLFYFYCGYGVGGSFIWHGQAVTGEDLLAGEVGKMIIADLEEGKHLTLEEAVSVSGIVKRVREKIPGIGFEEIIKHCEENDPVCTAYVQHALETVSRILYNLMWLYNPTKFVVGSCYPEYTKLLVKNAREYMQRLHKEDIYVTTEIEPAVYDEWNQMRGCFRTVLQKWMEDLSKEETTENTGETREKLTS